MKDTNIAWCHDTFNPWWGCDKVSPGCKNCYAESWAKRWGKRVWGPQAPRSMMSDKHWGEPIKWNQLADESGERRRVFCASMADVCEDRRELDASRERLWELIDRTPCLDWMLLTKRPENLSKLVPEATLLQCWVGTTTEDQEHAERRIPHLLRVSAKVRFISAEPLLGPLDLYEIAGENVFDPKCYGVCYCDSLFGYDPGCGRNGGDGTLTRKIDWVIVGGESGPKARPCDVTWIEDVVTDAGDGSVPCFVKQLGSKPYDSRESDRGEHEPHPEGAAQDLSCRLRLAHPKGGDPAEWANHLQVQKFPS